MADDDDHAPTYPLPPSTEIVSIAHPCILHHHLPTALRSLGGEQHLRHVLDHEIGESTEPAVAKGQEPSVGISLRPDDPFAKRIPSTAERTRDVLIKVTLPARTGRKRKRESDRPWEGCSDGREALRSITAPDLLRRMRDHAASLRVEVQGTITTTHRFRTLPDLQQRAAEIPLMRHLRDNLLPATYDNLRSFNPHPSTTSPDQIPPTFPAPPIHLPQTFPRPPGGTGTTNTTTTILPTPQPLAPRKPTPRKPTSSIPSLRTLLVPPTALSIPMQPPPNLPPLDPTRAAATVEKKFRVALKERPVMTRLYYTAVFPHRDADIRKALPFVAYYFDAGPWRHAVVRLGVDPRSESTYGIYQTFKFSRAVCEKIRSGPEFLDPGSLAGKGGRAFDGVTLGVQPDETWQICDFLGDVHIGRVVREARVRESYDEVFGWYFNGTMAKIVVVAVAKMMRLASPGDEAWDVGDAEFDFIVDRIPEEVGSVEECLLPSNEGHSIPLQKLAERIGVEAVRGTYLALRGYEEEVLIPATRGNGEDGAGGEGEEISEGDVEEGGVVEGEEGGGDVGVAVDPDYADDG